MMMMKAMMMNEWTFVKDPSPLPGTGLSLDPGSGGRLKPWDAARFYPIKSTILPYCRIGANDENSRGYSTRRCTDGPIRIRNGNGQMNADGSNADRFGIRKDGKDIT